MREEIEKMRNKKNKAIKIVAIILVLIILITYKQILIRFSVWQYCRDNNLQDYKIESIEKVTKMNGYVIRINNSSGQERSLYIDSIHFPLGITNDSEVGR